MADYQSTRASFHAGNHQFLNGYVSAFPDGLGSGYFISSRSGMPTMLTREQAAEIHAALGAWLDETSPKPVAPEAPAEDQSEWEPTRWWRAVAPDGSVWCESSSETEVRERARPTDQIEHLYHRARTVGWWRTDER